MTEIGRALLPVTASAHARSRCVQLKQQKTIENCKHWNRSAALTSVRRVSPI